MKTLKFMLAAATAIGLASASQAAGPYDGSTDFESDTLNTSITTSDSYWTVPTGAEEGDYTFVAGNPVSDQSSPAVSRSAGAQSAFTNTPSKVLQLEGGTDPLTRKIKTGDPINLATAGDVYVDTLVKFTVTPAGDTVTVGDTDKLMVYLKENLTSGFESTNLVVKTCNFAVSVVPGMGDTLEVLDVDTGVSVAPNTWYRLTVKASAKDLGDGRYLPVFTIKVGSTQLNADAGLANGDSDTTLFPSILGAVATPTIASVGFAGSGAVDDLLFTTFPPEATVIDFTLAVADANNGISGDVAYVTTGASGNLQAIAYTTGQVLQYASVPGETPSPVTVTYSLNSNFGAAWDNNITATEDNGVFTASFVPTANTTYTLTVTQDAPAYPTYAADADATVKANYDAWKTTYGADTASAYENQFLVNAAPATTVPNTALAITEIKENATAGWDIVVECTVSGVDLSGVVGTAKAGNGYLAVSYADSLTGTWTTENINITASANGKVTVNVNKSGAKFMKVKLSTALESVE